jgi:hypothetical protein
MAQINGPRNASEERRVEVKIARSIRNHQVSEGETLTPESLVQRGLIERDDSQYAVDALDNLTARDMLDYDVPYLYVVKRSPHR